MHQCRQSIPTKNKKIFQMKKELPNKNCGAILFLQTLEQIFDKEEQLEDGRTDEMLW